MNYRWIPQKLDVCFSITWEAEAWLPSIYGSIYKWNSATSKVVKQKYQGDTIVASSTQSCEWSLLWLQFAYSKAAPVFARCT